MASSSPALATQESVDALTELVKALHVKMDKFLDAPSAVKALHVKMDKILEAPSALAPPTVSPPSINDTYASVVRALADTDKIKGKSQRAVLVGSTEKATPQETAKHDEATLKEIVECTKDPELKKAYEAGTITHHRFPENKQPGRRIVKYSLPSTDLRDRLLSGLRTIGRPTSFEPAMFVRRDLMPSELSQERIARDEARKRNIQSGCLMWGVRDCELIKFRGPSFRPLPPNYSTTLDKSNRDVNGMKNVPAHFAAPTPAPSAANVTTRKQKTVEDKKTPLPSLSSNQTTEDKKTPLPSHSPNPNTVDSGGKTAKDERAPLIF